MLDKNINEMKKIPYGISSFETIKTDGYYFVDKTMFIEKIENLGGQVFVFSPSPAVWEKPVYLDARKLL